MTTGGLQQITNFGVRHLFLSLLYFNMALKRLNKQYWSCFYCILECSCDRRGTDDKKCPAGSPCFCDQETGECPCRKGVKGALCNECADGYWNLDGESGCEPCNCDPEHALNYVCEKVNTVSCVNIIIHTINSLFTISVLSQRASTPSLNVLPDHRPVFLPVRVWRQKL